MVMAQIPATQPGYRIKARLTAARLGLRMLADIAGFLE
jgi:hypothetical protein